MNISAVMIVRDAEATLRASLESLRGFDEVIVYDNGSADHSRDIAREFPNVRLIDGDFTGFGPTKNRAAGHAGHDWIFSIDSDERVSPELMQSLANLSLSDAARVYRVLRVNYLMGKPVRRAGWGGDWLIRLYHRGTTGLTDVAVHEQVRPPPGGHVECLDGALYHDAVRELGDFLKKVDRYSETYRDSPRRFLSPPLALIRAWWAFVRAYFFQLGILDGWRGLVIAVSNANGTFFKYMKPWADRAVARERGEKAQK